MKIASSLSTRNKASDMLSLPSLTCNKKESSDNWREFTPPPSPFGSKSSSATSIPKTPSSVRTAETESINSNASWNTNSTTMTQSYDRSPSSTKARCSRPKTSIAVTEFFPYQYQCHVLNEYTDTTSMRPPLPMVGSTVNKNGNPFWHLTTPKQTYAKKASKNIVFDLPVPHDYDSSNHSRRSNCSSISNSSASHSGSTQNSRKQKIKTELCQYYLSNAVCPYGSGCHYAHGKEELQKKSLLDLQNRGLIEDAYTYRIKPCFSHVATGSCPFGKRCACIHDPRVTGTAHSWLPVTETQGNNIMTDINVEGLYQKRRFGILYGDPFVGEPRFSAHLTLGVGDLDDYQYAWSDIYNTVANIDNQQSFIAQKRRHSQQQIMDVHKLSIALQMHGGTHKWMYKYRPSHTIFNELCMVLDKRAFHLNGDSGQATPIPLSKYQPKNPKHCMVREIAFGPDNDPSVRPVALWFNIAEDQVTECSIEKQKMFRWHKRQKSKTKDKPRSRNTSSPSFDCLDSFAMIRPIDQDAFSLVRSILEHRYATIRAERITSIRERFAALEEMSKEYALLCDKFSNLKRHWTTWSYPRVSGWTKIDEHTPVPPVDAEYVPNSFPSEETEDRNVSVPCRESGKMWESFLSTLTACKNGGTDCASDNDAASAVNATSYFMDDFKLESKEDTRPRRRRLSVFVRLSRGENIYDGNRTLPHINRRRWNNIGTANGQHLGGKPKDSYLRQSERCWRSLMLQSGGEWGAVVDHFTNSARSQKVLNIVQQ